MKYQIRNLNDDSIIFEGLFEDEISDYLDFNDVPNYYITKIHTCRGDGCDEPAYERLDAYGITTGHWCDSCYENNYPYRKDRYPTIEYDGWGERLNDDY